MTRREETAALAASIRAAGKRWQRREKPHLGVVRVLGVVEGFVVFRMRSAPQLRSVREFVAECEPAPLPVKARKA
jgi:hypothetical protein